MKAFLKILKRILPIIALAEGFEHIILSTITFWGIFANHIQDIRIWANPSFDFVFGMINILTGFIFGRRDDK